MFSMKGGCFMDTLGKRIKHFRVKKGLTQRQLAELIGVKHNSISDWENDKNSPYSDTMELLAGALEVDANDLLCWGNPQNVKEDAELLASRVLANPKIKHLLPKIAGLNEDDMELLMNFIQRLSKEKE